MVGQEMFNVGHDGEEAILGKNVRSIFLHNFLSLFVNSPHLWLRHKGVNK